MQIGYTYNKPYFTNNVPTVQNNKNDRKTALKYNLKYWAQDVVLLSALALIGNHSKPWKDAIKDTATVGILCGSGFSIVSLVSNNLSDYGKKAKEKYDTFNLTTLDKLKNIGIMTGISMAAISGVELLSKSLKEAVKELKIYLPIIAGIGTLGAAWLAYNAKKNESENIDMIS